jgi:hypothetical protein
MGPVGGCKQVAGRRLWSQLFVPASDDFVQIDEQRPTCGGGLTRPATVVRAGPQDAPFLPAIAWYRRQDDRNRSPLAGIGNVLAQVPAVSVDHLGVAGHLDHPLAGFVAVAFERGSRPIASKQLTPIVVAKLHQDKVPGPESLQGTVPEPFGKVSATAASAEGPVFDLHLGRVEMIGKDLAPTPEVSLAATAAVFDRGIADQDHAQRFRAVGDRNEADCQQRTDVTVEGGGQTAEKLEHRSPRARSEPASCR